ncbi:MAG: EI24 domain-containing protein, partial [Deltaproteobacteria bacterium]|nr:EI24 domain-containing protein [Deltaproteobacteria bacterium]
MKRIFSGITGGFAAGFKAPLQAAALILKTPSLAALVVIPLAINIGLYILFFRYGSAFLEGLIQSWTAQWSSNLPAWAAWVAPLGRVGLKFLAWLLLILVSALSFTLVSGIIAAPFNDYLSAMTGRVYRRRLGLSEAAEPHAAAGFMGVIRLEAKRTLILLFGGAIAFFVGFLPLMQLPALAMGAMLVAF